MTINTVCMKGLERAGGRAQRVRAPEGWGAPITAQGARPCAAAHVVVLVRHLLVFHLKATYSLAHKHRPVSHSSGHLSKGGKPMNRKQFVVGVLVAGCFIGAAATLSGAGQAQDAKVKTAMDTLKSMAEK